MDTFLEDFISLEIPKGVCKADFQKNVFVKPYGLFSNISAITQLRGYGRTNQISENINQNTTDQFHYDKIFVLKGFGRSNDFYQKLFAWNQGKKAEQKENKKNKYICSRGKGKHILITMI